MHTITFYPIGNADTCLIALEGGKRLLFDYAHMRNCDDESDLRIDLEQALRDQLAKDGRDDYDVVGFSHLDRDHINRASEFFHLEHDKKYQGTKRAKINELWVPAAMIVEDPSELSDEAKIIQKEARYRLRNGQRIRVFSRPEALKGWLEGEGLSLDHRRALITDAGQLVPGFEKGKDLLEFFVHSPFAERADGELIDRNRCSLVFQVTFLAGDRETRFMLTADSPHEELSEIVRITKAHKNEGRLAWDIFDLPHHCSYLSLAPEKGKDKTEPVPDVRWLFEQGAKGAKIVSPSDPIPSEDTDQPPHRQAAKYYEDLCQDIGGEFLVTMQHPKRSAPEPLVITIGSSGATTKKSITASGITVISRPAPRAG